MATPSSSPLSSVDNETMKWYRFFSKRLELACMQYPFSRRCMHLQLSFNRVSQKVQVDFKKDPYLLPRNCSLRHIPLLDSRLSSHIFPKVIPIFYIVPLRVQRSIGIAPLFKLFLLPMLLLRSSKKPTINSVTMIFVVCLSQRFFFLSLHCSIPWNLNNDIFTQWKSFF